MDTLEHSSECSRISDDFCALLREQRGVFICACVHFQTEKKQSQTNIKTDKPSGGRRGRRARDDDSLFVSLYFTFQSTRNRGKHELMCAIILTSGRRVSAYVCDVFVPLRGVVCSRNIK